MVFCPYIKLKISLGNITLENRSRTVFRSLITK